MISYRTTTREYEAFKADVEALRAKHPGMSFTRATGIIRATKPESQAAVDEAVRARRFIEEPRASEQAKTFAENLDVTKRIDEIAAKLFREHRDKYPTIERARAAAWDKHPELKRQAYESQSRRSMRFEDPDDVADELRDSETRARKKQRSRNDVIEAVAEVFGDDIRKRVEQDGMSRDEAIENFIRDVLAPALAKRAPRAKASSEKRTFSAGEFARELQRAGVRNLSEELTTSALKKFANAC